MTVIRCLVALAIVILVCIPASAQFYGYGQSTGTSDPYDYTTSGTTVLAITSDDVYSAEQTLPFSWPYYGVNQSTYYVSDNGYITFAASPGSSDPTNTAIPSAGGPNNAIYAFWDGLGVVSGSGSTDEVLSWTYGETPNRVHVIQWYSVTPDSGSGFIYAAIRLYECGDFDVVLNFGNATSMTATVGTEDATGAAGTQVTGSPNLPYPSVGSDGSDDVVYTFYWTGIQYDLSVASLDLGGRVPIGINDISGSVVNLGSVNVTSFDLHYSVDGGSSVVDSISGISIPPFGGTYSFTHSTPWNVAAGGEEHEVTVWAEAINGGFSDQRTCNDEISTEVLAALDLWGMKRVLLEVFTGSWCGWCPDGRVVRDEITYQFGESVAAIDIHDGDGMEFSDGIRPEFGVSAYPNGMVDRTVFPGEGDEPHSRGAWAANVQNQLGAYTPLNMGVSSTFVPASRQVNVTATAGFTDYAGGDLRFVCMLSEDNVIGSGTGWDQTNYLNGTAGHPYFGAGDPILGYDHQHVLRDLSSAVGTPGAISTPTSPGQIFTEPFVFTLAPEVDEAEVDVTCFVTRYGGVVGDREVLNVRQAPLGESRELPLFASSFNSGRVDDWSSVSP